MNKKQLCRRCLLRDMQQADMESVIHFYERLPERLRVSPQEYDSRLNRCRTCDGLQNGTCMHCGCYVEVRAAQRKGSCPMDYWKEA